MPRCHPQGPVLKHAECQPAGPQATQPRQVARRLPAQRKAKRISYEERKAKIAAKKEKIMAFYEAQMGDDESDIEDRVNVRCTTLARTRINPHLVRM